VPATELPIIIKIGALEKAYHIAPNSIAPAIVFSIKIT
jgi:hypothetical protein